MTGKIYRMHLWNGEKDIAVVDGASMDEVVLRSEAIIGRRLNIFCGDSDEWNKFARETGRLITA